MAFATSPQSHSPSETNNLRDVGMADWLPAGARTVDWTDIKLYKIKRIRFLSEPGFPCWDLSYCWGEMNNGERVRVRCTPLNQLKKGQKYGIKGAIVIAARAANLNAKRLGLFDPEVISTLI
jgi:hypothetical protein